MYERFFSAFAAMGEASIPIDRRFMAGPGFYELLDRLRRHAEQYQRDHWWGAHLFWLVTQHAWLSMQGLR